MARGRRTFLRVLWLRLLDRVFGPKLEWQPPHLLDGQYRGSYVLVTYRTQQLQPTRLDKWLTDMNLQTAAAVAPYVWEKAARLDAKMNALESTKRLKQELLLSEQYERLNRLEPKVGYLEKVFKDRMDSWTAAHMALYTRTSKLEERTEKLPKKYGRKPLPPPESEPCYCGCCDACRGGEGGR